MSGLFITGRGAINAWECDQWGHLNVQFYLAKASDAQALLAARLGLVPSRLRGPVPCMMPVADRTLFKRELRAGDIYAIRTGIRGVATDGTLDIASRMVNQDTGVESAVFETRLRWVAADRHTALPWPEDVLAAAQALAGDLPEAPPPMAQTAPAAPDIATLELTYRGSVEPWECGADGIAPPRAHIARFNDAITHLFNAMKIDRNSLFRRGFGSAALDYDIEYRRPMRSGQGVDIRSGLLAAGEKIFHVVHYVVDAVSGEIITSIVVTALFFDLTARRSVPIRQALPGEAGGLLAALAARTRSAA
ncbi:MAG: thioesterase family protein [Aquabacterium sp.]|nr:thioesterase family protein [Aquabacterium sp.]